MARDRLKVENQWFYWDSNKKFKCGSIDDKVALENIYGKNIILLIII